MTTYRIKDDWNLEAAIMYNSPGIAFVDISEVLAHVEGEHDGPDYYWVLKLHNGQVGLLQGGCDYTGWDCWSDATWTPTATAEEAVDASTDYDKVRLDETKRDLWRQLPNGPLATRRQEVGEALDATT